MSDTASEVYKSELVENPFNGIESHISSRDMVLLSENPFNGIESVQPYLLDIVLLELVNPFNGIER